MLSKKANAKINLTLHVIKRLPSGYHEVESAMQQVELHDTVLVKKIKSGITIKCNHPEVPLGSKNIAYKAAELIKKKYNIEDGVEITIEKKIPIAAGLSGGSTDAGAVLILMNELFDLGLKKDELIKLGADIGMDVPFSISGRAAIATGRGGELKKIEGVKMDILLINPGIMVSTKEAYENLNLRECGNNLNTKEMLIAIKERDIKKIADHLHNDFETSVIKKNPIIGIIKKDLMENGALNALMSGSGSTVFGIFENYEKAEKAYRKLNKKYPIVVLSKTI